MTSSGVKILTPRCDISDENAVKEVFQEAERGMLPIRGCIQASMVLKVSELTFHNATLDHSTTVAAHPSRVWNLQHNVLFLRKFFLSNS
jgi:hypothetical protein